MEEWFVHVVFMNILSAIREGLGFYEALVKIRPDR